ncbi:MAG: hypothetical protein WD751_10410 [Anaerolineales bacterium]
MVKFSVSSETSFLRAGLGELKDYLLSNEVFWNAGSSQQLTLGNLLLAKEYLDGVGKLPAAEAKELAAHKKEWRSAWENKAEREVGARLRQWTQYLNELVEHPDRHASYYATEVRVRMLLELLAHEAPGVRSQLAAADSTLRSLTASGDFMWGKDAEAAFPKGKYWFLWVKVKSNRQ